MHQKETLAAQESQEAGRVGRGQCCCPDAEAAQGSAAEVTAVEQMQMYQAK